jgi:hypothetical protein
MCISIVVSSFLLLLLEPRAPVKRLVSLQFPNLKTVGRSPWTGDQPDARLLPIQDNTNTE